MRRQQASYPHPLWIVPLFGLFTALLVTACGRSSDSAPSGIDTQSSTSTNTYTGSNTFVTPPPPSLNSTTDTSTSTSPTTVSYSCTLSLTSGAPVATLSGQQPSPVTYTLSFSAAPPSTPQPQLTISPSGALNVTSMVPNGSMVTINGNFVTAGSVNISASTNISGQVVSCHVTTQVTQAAPSEMIVQRCDRANPPDIFYMASGGACPSGYTLAGNMFKVYSQQPPSSICQSIPLNQCLLPIAPNAVDFLSQVANCGGNPVVATLGYTCATNVAGTVALWRLYNTVDHRFYTTANTNDIQILVSQGVWTTQAPNGGIIGYAPLQ